MAGLKQEHLYLNPSPGLDPSCLTLVGERPSSGAGHHPLTCTTVGGCWRPGVIGGTIQGPKAHPVPPRTPGPRLAAPAAPRAMLRRKDLEGEVGEGAGLSPQALEKPGELQCWS